MDIASCFANTHHMGEHLIVFANTPQTGEHLQVFNGWSLSNRRTPNSAKKLAPPDCIIKNFCSGTVYIYMLAKGCHAGRATPIAPTHRTPVKRRSWTPGEGGGGGERDNSFGSRHLARGQRIYFYIYIYKKKGYILYIYI